MNVPLRGAIYTWKGGRYDSQHFSSGVAGNLRLLGLNARHGRNVGGQLHPGTSPCRRSCRRPDSGRCDARHHRGHGYSGGLYCARDPRWNGLRRRACCVLHWHSAGHDGDQRPGSRPLKLRGGRACDHAGRHLRHHRCNPLLRNLHHQPGLAGHRLEGSREGRNPQALHC